MPGVLATGTAAEDVTVTPAVAQIMECIMQVASARGATQSRLVAGPRDAASRAARTCYDHLADRLGVALAEALVEGGAYERWRNGYQSRRRVFRPNRHRPRCAGDPQRQALGSRFVQTMSRLERAAPSPSRRHWRSLMRALLWEGLDTPQQRHPRRHDHPKGWLVFRDEFDVRLE